MRYPLLLRPLRWVVVLSAVLMLPTSLTEPTASAPLPSEPWEELTASIPARPLAARTGSEFVLFASGMTPVDRRQAIHDELLAGNLPGFLRRLSPVELTWKDGKVRHSATIFVTPDYLAIGSNEDFVRMPMGLYTAVVVAREFGFVLPTRKMVDAIYRQADVRLAPKPMKPGPKMTSVDYLWRHDLMIKAQLDGIPLGELVAGDKKDLVLTNRLLRKARRVAIYGWHRTESAPIQPLSTVHDGRYADYSHGVRLVSATVVVDGQTRSVFDVLEDPLIARVLSYEGTITTARPVMSLPFTPGETAPQQTP